jgi:hypothetical protein
VIEFIESVHASLTESESQQRLGEEEKLGKSQKEKAEGKAQKFCSEYP